MDTNSFVICIKTEDFYDNIADDVKKWFDTSNCSKDDNRPLLIGWIKKNSLFKNELGEETMKKFLGIWAKTWLYT